MPLVVEGSKGRRYKYKYATPLHPTARSKRYYLEQLSTR